MQLLTIPFTCENSEPLALANVHYCGVDIEEDYRRSIINYKKAQKKLRLLKIFSRDRELQTAIACVANMLLQRIEDLEKLIERQNVVYTNVAS